MKAFMRSCVSSARPPAAAAPRIRPGRASGGWQLPVILRGMQRIARGLPALKAFMHCVCPRQSLHSLVCPLRVAPLCTYAWP